MGVWYATLLSMWYMGVYLPLVSTAHETFISASTNPTLEAIVIAAMCI